MNLKDGSNGELSSREAGSIGDQMVKKMLPIRTVSVMRTDRTSPGHRAAHTYRFSLMV